MVAAGLRQACPRAAPGLPRYRGGRPLSQSRPRQICVFGA
ncbi:hypothetical protein C7456_10941 [Fulvimonas soli]|uniref:Uncharacterized protein n=1 Tax=Fulvimonas soli TaxID=155197 RepID=A0A316HX25_9GAMM|nr:hypothetical protein C7456_10941 [Fulvimonas soli]